MPESSVETVSRGPCLPESQRCLDRTISSPEASAPRKRGFPHARIQRTLVLIAALAVVALIGDIVWEKGIRDRVIAKHWAVVIPGKIYRSGQISPGLIEGMLTRHGIQVIINLQGASPSDANQQAEHEVALANGIAEYRCPLGGDGTGDIRSYAEALRIMQLCLSEDKPVLVHCAAGAQRTGGVIAAYRILIQGGSPQDAYAEMKANGWKPSKDQILIDYLNAHMAELARLLVELEVLDRAPEHLPVLGP